MMVAEMGTLALRQTKAKLLPLRLIAPLDRPPTCGTLPPTHDQTSSHGPMPHGPRSSVHGPQSTVDGGHQECGLDFPPSPPATLSGPFLTNTFSRAPSIPRPALQLN
jgi:hypothetical protein